MDRVPVESGARTLGIGCGNFHDSQTDPARRLAAACLRQGVVPPKYADDATPVAVCTVARLHYLVSWNFKHLVNVPREAGFNAVNLLPGDPPLRIVNPLELIHGNEDQNL